MSNNITGEGGGEAEGGSFSSGNTTTGEAEVQEQEFLNHFFGAHNSGTHHSLLSSAATPSIRNVFPSAEEAQQPPPPQQQAPQVKKKRSLPGNPDPTAEVIALSPTTLMATNRFICEICNKGFQRDQNLQLHRRGHNLPWKLKQRTSTEIRKRVYVCPEKTCVHHNPARALGDLTGIKKHFSRKHGEKKWKCERCSKKYAVQSDWKAHSKTCGTKEYKCDCGTIFSRRDSFITHRAFCDALTEENTKLINQAILAPNVPSGDRPISGLSSAASIPLTHTHSKSSSGVPSDPAFTTTADTKNPLFSLPHGLIPSPPSRPPLNNIPESLLSGNLFGGGARTNSAPMMSSSFGMTNGNNHQNSSAFMSATALLQKAAQMGATATSHSTMSDQTGLFVSPMAPSSIGGGMLPVKQARYDGDHFLSRFMEKSDGREEVGDEQLLNVNNNGGGGGGDQGVFRGLLLGPSSELLKSVAEVENNNNTNNNNNNNVGTTTVDFLGIGGTRSVGFNHQFHHQQHPTLDKPMWEV